MIVSREKCPNPETVKQNFKHLVMTSPGEKIMNPDFGVGLRNFLFENQDRGVVENFKERLYVQAEKYMPFVSIINVNTSFFENTFNVDIKYFIKPIAIEDALSLNVISK